ncbi:hypothetical protein ACIBHX_01535 [Nonomuraea sp. NPDC050536]|uniref:hypothetical protein n=1 Tax=Nonomuraea sp. NPDC050536 TaxID=3364366 RepID=UPI0037C6D69C
MHSQEDWQRVAKAVVERRNDRGWTQVDIAVTGPLSVDRVQAIEGARSTRYSPRTIANLERALEWQKGSVQAILDGKEPTPAESAGTQPSAPEVDAPTAIELGPDAAAATLKALQQITETLKREREEREIRDREEREAREALRRQLSEVSAKLDRLESAVDGKEERDSA